MLRATVFTFVLALGGCASHEVSTDADTGSDFQREFELLEAGYQELPKNSKRAKARYFDPVIESCTKAFGGTTKRYYSARTGAESLYYTLKGVAEGQTAQILVVPCGEAHYLAAYVSIDLGDIVAAEDDLTSALLWSPVNSQYQSELAHLMQIRGNWNEALRLFSQAEDNSKGFSPDEVREAELTRAKRGIGFALIELGRHEEAKAKFRECLEIDPNDEKAKHELTYLSELSGNTP